MLNWTYKTMLCRIEKSDFVVSKHFHCLIVFIENIENIPRNRKIRFKVFRTNKENKATMNGIISFNSFNSDFRSIKYPILTSIVI